MVVMEEVLGQLVEGEAVAIHAVVCRLQARVQLLLQLAVQSLTPSVSKRQWKQIGASSDGLLQQGCGIDAETQRSVSAHMEMAELSFVVMDCSYQLAEIEGLFQLFAAQFGCLINNRAIASVVLPGTMQIIEGCPAIQPFSALVVLQKNR